MKKILLLMLTAGTAHGAWYGFSQGRAAKPGEQLCVTVDGGSGPNLYCSAANSNNSFTGSGAAYGTLVGGGGNIFGPSLFSGYPITMLGGAGNTGTGTGTVIGGTGNQAGSPVTSEEGGIILAGSNNSVMGSAAGTRNSVILGGSGNTISGAYGKVVGGRNVSAVDGDFCSNDGIHSTLMSCTLESQFKLDYFNGYEFLTGPATFTVVNASTGAFGAVKFLDGSIQTTAGGGIGSLPAGTILPYGSASPPAGTVACDGLSYATTTYPILYSKIACNFGCADGTHFNVPKLQGQFLRGWDNGAGVDPDAGLRGPMAAGGSSGDAVGSVQLDTFTAHVHALPYEAYNGNGTGGGPVAAQYIGPGSFMHLSQDSGGNETRPKNVYVLYAIKVDDSAQTSSGLAMDNAAITLTGASGVVVGMSSITASAFFGDGSHLSGVVGTSGASGAAGAVGASGASGADGMAGASGATGATGESGAAGTAGATGASGASGADGVAGASGADGIAGASGATGATGESGASGADGIAGVSGATGQSGASGASPFVLAGTSYELSSPTNLSSYGLFYSSGNDNVSLGGMAAQMWNNTAGNGPGLYARRARYAAGVSTNALTNDYILQLLGRGYGDTGYSNSSDALIGFQQDEAAHDNAKGNRFVVLGTPIGGTTKRSWLIMRDRSADFNENVTSTGVISAAAMHSSGTVTAAGTVYADKFTNLNGPQNIVAADIHAYGSLKVDSTAQFLGGITSTATVTAVNFLGEGSNLTFTNPVTFLSSVTILGEGGVLETSSITARAANFGSGQEGGGLTINGVKQNTMVFSGDTLNAYDAHYTLHEHSTTKAPKILSGRSNANGSGHTNVVPGQSVLDIMGTGVVNNSGTSYSPFGLIQMVVSATGTVTSTSSPGNIVLATPPDGSTTPVARMTIDSAGNAILAAGGAFYGVGSHLTGLSVISTSTIPQYSFSNTAYDSVVVATTTVVIRDAGNVVDINLVAIASNTTAGGGDSVISSLWIDGGCSVAPACIDIGAARVSSGNDIGQVGFPTVSVFGLSPGSHTIAVRFRVSGGTGTIFPKELALGRIRVEEHP